MIQTLTIHQPYHHAATGQTYRLCARFNDHSEEAYFSSERAALDARDLCFDRGAHAVHLAGLPLIVATAGFPVVEGPFPEVED